MENLLIITIIQQYLKENHPSIQSQIPHNRDIAIWTQNNKQASIHHNTRITPSPIALTYYPTKPYNPHKSTSHQLPRIEDPNFFPELDKALQKWQHQP